MESLNNDQLDATRGPFRVTLKSFVGDDDEGFEADGEEESDEEYSPTASSSTDGCLGRGKSESVQSDESDEETAGLRVNTAAIRPKALSLIPTSARTSTRGSPPAASPSKLAGAGASCLHSLKLVLFSRTEPCAVCSKSISGFFHQGYKCSNCKLCFHKECNVYAVKFACVLQEHTSPESRTKKINEPISPKSFLSPLSSASSRAAAGARWLLNRTTQFTDPNDQIVSSLEELRQISVFIFKKIVDLTEKSQKQRDTVVDAIFKKALKEFHTELLSYQATTKDDQISMKYKDLISSFQWVLEKVCLQEQQQAAAFPVTLGVNAFRGFLNEFMNTTKKSSDFKARTKSFRKKRRKSDVTIHLGHRFKPDIVHVPTYCEVCNQFMWHAEKIWICEGCRISCHKKCHAKLTEKCHVSSKECMSLSGRVFGGDLSSLVDEDNFVPNFLERMITAVELHGLFLEGVYRKSGSVVQVKQYRKQIDVTSDLDQLTFDDVPIHVLTALVKSFFRELAEPLMTFDLYENFLNVSEVEDEKDRLRCIYSMVELLPKINRAVLDRLMYHLARVAYQSEINRMSSQNLAVIFAPCLLKRNFVVKAQEQLKDVSRQTSCVKTLIDEKLRQYVATINEIVQLENAAEKVSSNLIKIKQHLTRDYEAKDIEQAKHLFEEQLHFLDAEREKLIEELPPFAPVASSEDDCLTSGDESTDPVKPPCHQHRRKQSAAGATSAHSAYGERSVDEYAVDFAIPPLFPVLKHPTKRRVARPKRQQRPSKNGLRRILTPVSVV